MKTIPVGTVSDLIKADTLFWGALMASAVLGSFPIAFIYSFFVKYYVSGLTAGAVKGMRMRRVNHHGGEFRPVSSFLHDPDQLLEMTRRQKD